MSALMGNGLAGMLNVMGASGARAAGQQFGAALQQAVQQQNAARPASVLSADQMEAIAASLQVIETAINRGHVVHVSDRDGELFEALRMTLALAGVKLDPKNHPGYLRHCEAVVDEEKIKQEAERQKRLALLGSGHVNDQWDAQARMANAIAGVPSSALGGGGGGSLAQAAVAAGQWQDYRSIYDSGYQWTREEREAMRQQRQEAQRYFNEQFNIAAPSRRTSCCPTTPSRSRKRKPPRPRRTTGPGGATR